MPEVSRFFGIVISMFYNDHEPPHFHARYSSRKVLIEIETLGALRGELPPRVLGLVTEWAAIHRDELLANWRRARSEQPLEPIDPLE